MMLNFLTLFSAISISVVAAVYSLIGLAAIFSGAQVAVLAMGGVLELAKVVTASWLYNNWKKTPVLLKSYLTIAVVILILITSMGIFGFLSKAHIDSTLSVGDNTVQLKVLNEQEKITQNRLEFLLKKAGDDPTKIARKTAEQIQQTQDELIAIQQKKLPLLKEENKALAEIGPLKYIAELIYGAEASNHFDAAVRWVIITLIFVFDPLAVLLLIAANQSIRDSRMAKIEEEKIADFREIDTKNIEPVFFGPEGAAMTPDSLLKEVEQEEKKEAVKEDEIKEVDNIVREDQRELWEKFQKRNEWKVENSGIVQHEYVNEERRMKDK